MFIFNQSIEPLINPQTPSWLYFLTKYFKGQKKRHFKSLFYYFSCSLHMQLNMWTFISLSEQSKNKKNSNQRCTVPNEHEPVQILKHRKFNVFCFSTEKVQTVILSLSLSPRIQQQY